MEFFANFINIFKKLNLKLTKYKYRKYLKNSHCKSGVKNFIGKDYSVRFDSVFEERKKEVQKKVENIVRKAKNNPYRLIAYVEKHKTKVYRIKFADKILAIVNETEGFITPKKGLKAVYLNLAIKKKLSLTFKECFVMRNLPLDPYYTIHQFYSWYAFKSGFAGYEYEAQEKFRTIICSQNRNVKIDNLSIADILSIKEAIRRDIEALDFVINLAKNTDGAKKAFDKIVLKTSPVNI